MSREKRILIIASEFPPRGIGNVLRTVKLVKHLPIFGWKPYVLTVSKNSIVRFDHSYDNEIPKEARILRASYPNPFLFSDVRWHRKKTESQRRGASASDRGNKTKSSLRFPGKRFVLSFINFFRQHIFIPGWLMVWVPFAVAKGVWICFRERIDFIYSTAPSYENHLVGLLIKMITQKKWMADYRDLWTDYPTRRISSKYRKKVEEKMETLVLKNADAVNIVSPKWREFLLRRFPFLPPEKVTCYTNGFDSEDYLIDSQSQPSGSNQWRITYAGTVLRRYPTPLFLKALGGLCEEIPGLKEEVKVDFYGSIRNEQLVRIKEVIEKFSLQENVSINGSVLRQEALRIIEHSDLLLLMYIEGVPNVDGCIPAKLFEYIGVRKPVFGIVPQNGAAAEIILKGKMGMLASPSSYEEIKNGLKQLYLTHKYDDNSFELNWDYLKQFDRRYIVSKLVDIFNRLAFQ